MEGFTWVQKSTLTVTTVTDLNRPIWSETPRLSVG